MTKTLKMTKYGKLQMSYIKRDLCIIKAQFMKRIKQHFFYPKIRQIASYSPYFWLKNALFSTFPKSHFNYAKVSKQYLILILLMLFIKPVFAQTLTSQVDRKNIEKGDIITLVMQADFQTSATPSFLPLKDQFEVLSTQRSNQILMVNGEFKSFTRWDIRLIPKQVGQLIIPPLTIANAKSPPIKIQVTNLTKNKHQLGVSFLEASVNITTAYVQQQIIYTLRFYYRGILTRGNTNPPVFTNAMSQQLTNQVKFQKKINGITYEVFEWSWAFFPQQSGELVIPAQIFTGQIHHDGRTKRVNEQSKPIILSIKPIPASYPKHALWLPAISIEVVEDWQYDANIKVGDSISRTIQIRATGLQASQLPKINLIDQPQFHHYPDKSKLENKATPRNLTSQSTREIVIIPIKEGEFTLPEYKVYWWNTAANQLETAILPTKTFNILPAVVIEEPAKLIITETIADDTISKDKPLDTPQNLILWQVLTLFFAIVWLITLFLLLKQKKTTVVSAKVQQVSKKPIHLIFCNKQQMAEPKQFYQTLTNWLQLQTNVHNIKNTISLELNQLTAHLFNNQPLADDCLIQICKKIQVITSIEKETNSKKQLDKLEKLYP